MSGEKLDSNENLTYLAPEVIKRGHYSKKSDIYSVGIILYAMLVGKPPFINND
jgi:serine/threonine protein kinase